MVVRSKSKPKAARAVRRKKQPSLQLRYRHAVTSAELAVAARQRMERDLEIAVEQKNDAVTQVTLLEEDVRQLQQHRAELLRLVNSLRVALDVAYGMLEHSTPADSVFVVMSNAGLVARDRGPQL